MKHTDCSFQGKCRKDGLPQVWMAVAMLITVFFCGNGPAMSSTASGPSAVLKTVSADNTPFFEDDLDYDFLEKAIHGSIAYYQKLPPEKPFALGGDTYTARHMIRSMQFFLSFIEKRPSPGALQDFINQYYDVYAYHSGPDINDMLFTGYYEPLLFGSLDRTEVFRYPVYGRPGDLVVSSGKESYIGRYDGNTIVPYFTRAQITAMAPEAFNAPLIAWVNDPVALFFLHIQGSGKIRLNSGRIINVHYTISNGRPYRSIGNYLIKKKKMTKETVSMQSIRNYLNDHAEEVEAIFNYNPRYVFFETMENGPIGCFNIELTPGRSVALDRRTAPPGALVFVQTEKPEIDDAGHIRHWVRFSRFLLNQDTGSAIKGPGRADIFWGNGAYAELAAGYMKQPGRLYFLVLKP